MEETTECQAAGDAFSPFKQRTARLNWRQVVKEATSLNCRGEENGIFFRGGGSDSKERAYLDM